jgi:hypothetical protein
VKLEYWVAIPLFLFGIVSALRSLGRPIAEEQAGGRLLIAIHEASKAMFWFALGGFFLVYGVTDGDPVGRWLAIVPIVLAAVRLLTASALSRT